MKLAKAREYAFQAGATAEEVEKETNFQLKSVGSTPFNNMIVALSILPAMNTKDDWVRLVAALQAKYRKKK
tara:strand:- start:57 stop:269 length:213 start_codon:yes stop_codon:yes gene_type:complete